MLTEETAAQSIDGILPPNPQIFADQGTDGLLIYALLFIVALGGYFLYRLAVIQTNKMIDVVRENTAVGTKLVTTVEGFRDAQQRLIDELRTVVRNNQ